MKKNKKVLVKRIILPKGFHFKVRSDYDYEDVDHYPYYEKKYYNFTIELHHHDKYIGHVELNQVDSFSKKILETHSDLEMEYHNQKLGVKMYAKAIKVGMKHGFIVQSSGQSSDMAERVWLSKSLKEYFRVRQLPLKSRWDKGNTWRVYNKYVKE